MASALLGLSPTRCKEVHYCNICQLFNSPRPTSSLSNGSFMHTPLPRPKASVFKSCSALMPTPSGAHKQLLSPLESAIVSCANGDVGGKRPRVSMTCPDPVRHAIFPLKHVPW